ncbi:MAG: hypothetical protein GY858_01285 [Candidatus Omnitrophica bacterium]|nr:hypothetical protein [Candidatus Omnitrophota bacterium]
MKKGIKTAIGLTFVLLGIIAILTWWSDVMGVLRGSIGVFVVLVGALIITLAGESQ